MTSPLTRRTASSCSARQTAPSKATSRYLTAGSWELQQLHQQQQHHCQVCLHTESVQLTDRRTSKRQLLFAAAAAAAALLPGQPCAQAVSKPSYSPSFLSAFQRALSTSGSFEEMDAAWGRVIELGPTNAAAWSNRGTLRLQHQQWTAAYTDLQQAVALEQQQEGSASAVVLNNLGNVEGALGRWEDAMQHYQQAADDAEMGSISSANYALAAWETGQSDVAVKAARKLLRRDPEFLDMRCALTAFLWGSGRRSEAEDSWEQLQQASDGLGAALYNRSTAVERVRHRWPPRATAALVAFLTLSDEGQAEGYDLQVHSYRFPQAA